MSRRRDPKPPSVVAGSFVTVRFVCTGRNRHNAVAFGKVQYFPASRQMNVRLEAEEHFVEDWEGLAASDDSGDDSYQKHVHVTYTLRCARCRPQRHVPLTKMTLQRLCAGLAEAQNEESPVDISALWAVDL